METMPTNDLIKYHVYDNGTVFFETEAFICKTKVIGISHNKIEQKFEFYKDRDKNRTYKSNKFWIVNHMRNWVASQLLELYKANYNFPSAITVTR